jgi:hypothetical protein
LGKRHESGHRFKIDYWEVFNEIDFEHDMTPEQYTERYDAVVSAIRKVAPRMKFVGLALAEPRRNPRMFEYFLNPRNHRPGIPLDMISYHFYAAPTADQTQEAQPYTFFAKADRFLAAVCYIEEIRRRLSPTTRTAINEIGAIRASLAARWNPFRIPIGTWRPRLMLMSSATSLPWGSTWRVSRN